MPTARFQTALQALRDGNEQFRRDWQPPVSAERHDGLESEAYTAAYLSKLIDSYPNRGELLVKLMESQEKRLNNSIEEAVESGTTSYAQSRSFHSHVDLTIDAVLHPENYADEILHLRHDCYAQASFRLEMKALGIAGRPKTGWQMSVEAARAPSQQRDAGRGRGDDEGPGWER